MVVFSYRPRRQRTKPIDIRPSRTSLGLKNRESIDPDQANSLLFGSSSSNTDKNKQLPRPAATATVVPSEETTPDVDRELPRVPLPTLGSTSRNPIATAAAAAAAPSAETRGDGELVSRDERSLKVETDGLAPPIPTVNSGAGAGAVAGGAFAASPIESTSAFPRGQDEHDETGNGNDQEEEEEQRRHEAEQDDVRATTTSRASRDSTKETMMETPFVPPLNEGDSSMMSSSSIPTTTTVVSEETVEYRRPDDSTGEADRPLTSSTSLKRRSVQAPSSSGATPGGSGRLRGARAPRGGGGGGGGNAVSDKVKRFEGGAQN